ncbi:hypothetical protein, partial [Escherichia coli]|uniref:hypothetical protein n=1 Tax=Escherichia coli TaxID=562 RepID=UPI00293BD4B5
MAIALMGAGFSATDTSDAVNILYPITMTVQANKAWQASGLKKGTVAKLAMRQPFVLFKGLTFQ